MPGTHQYIRGGRQATGINGLYYKIRERILSQIHGGGGAYSHWRSVLVELHADILFGRLDIRCMSVLKVDVEMKL